MCPNCSTMLFSALCLPSRTLHTLEQPQLTRSYTRNSRKTCRVLAVQYFSPCQHLVFCQTWRIAWNLLFFSRHTLEIPSGQSKLAHVVGNLLVVKCFVTNLWPFSTQPKVQVQYRSKLQITYNCTKLILHLYVFYVAARAACDIVDP